MTAAPDIVGETIYDLAYRLFPLPRSITGNAVRQTHDLLRTVIPELKTHEIPCGSKCFDWTIPDEWSVTDAYIETLDGSRIVDWRRNNLHLMSYSVPVDKVISRVDLLAHINTRPDLPDAIPYATSYYNRRWGFCMSENQRLTLTDDRYRAVIKSAFNPKGSMTYGEILAPGKLSDEILIHNYTCHPSMGNNETSGMAVAAMLARAILDMERRYSYRIVFVPETIGAVAYISRNLDALRRNTIAGFILTCVGDDRTYSMMPSRKGNTLADRAARHALDHVVRKPYTPYTFLQRGSDERQYCAPGVDLPVCSIMRSKYGTYPEYHTSLDDMSLISPEGLEGAYKATKAAIDTIEANESYRATVLCEPQLGPRGLRPPLERGRDLVPWSMLISNILAYSDGDHDLLSIAEMLNCSIFDVRDAAQALVSHDLLRVA